MPDIPTSRAPATSRRRRLLFIGIFLGILLVATLVAGEAVVRIYLWSRGWTPNCYVASLDLFRPHAERGYDLKPHFRLRSGAFKTSTNSLGLRGPEIGDSPDEDTIRIAMAGGSSAFGYLVDDGQEAARVLEENLQAAGVSAEVINGAVPGYNLYQSSGRFQDRIAQFQPDYLVLYLGYNDLAYICADDPRGERFRVRPVAPLTERLLAKSALYGLAKYRLLCPPITIQPVDRPGSVRTEAGCEQFRQNLTQMAAAAQAAGTRLIVCSQCMAAHPDAPEEVRRLVAQDPTEIDPLIESSRWVRDALEQFALDNGYPFVDVYTEIPPTPDYLGDDIHLTVEGEKRLAQLLADTILPLLQPEKAGLSD